MKDVLEILIPWLVSTAAIFAVILFDERRLRKMGGILYERTWPPAGRDSAIVGFGILAVPVHFIRTRRSIVGVLLAIAWTAAVMVVEAGVMVAFDAVAPDDDPTTTTTRTSTSTTTKTSARTSTSSPTATPTSSLTPHPPTPTSTSTTASCLSPSDLELLVPFYEGLRFAPAAAGFAEAGLERLDIVYPGALSMPFVAWRCGTGAWSITLVDRPDLVPVRLVARPTSTGVDLRLTMMSGGAAHTISASGGWESVAKAVRDAWNIHASAPPLASRVDRYDFFVRSWVVGPTPPPGGTSALRFDWQTPALLRVLEKEPPRTMAFVFGEDPNEVDLEGRYFWTDGAENEMRSLIAANPAVLHQHWLNLRTYKHAIPNLHIERAVPADVHADAKLYGPSHTDNDFDQYVFRSLEMCLAARGWQESRMREMKHLVDIGFRVVALDEYPTAPKWGPEPCTATNHLHRAGDFADEARIATDFVRRLAEYARAHDVLVTSEEPSAALVPFASGYMDGAFNDPQDMYERFASKPHAQPIALFSTAFGATATPYTRPAPKRAPPRGWLVQRKVATSSAP